MYKISNITTHKHNMSYFCGLPELFLMDQPQSSLKYTRPVEGV